jgi:hypothetical protein
MKSALVAFLVVLVVLVGAGWLPTPADYHASHSHSRYVPSSP